MTHDDGRIDYSGYSEQELIEARLNINAEEFPENFVNLKSEFERRGLTLPKLHDSVDSESDYSDHIYRVQARSPLKARLTGFATLVFGVAWFMFSYRDGVYHDTRGNEYTFDTEPLFVAFMLTIHASIVLMGLLGAVFGSGFYRDLIESQGSVSRSTKKE